MIFKKRQVPQFHPSLRRQLDVLRRKLRNVGRRSRRSLPFEAVGFAHTKTTGDIWEVPTPGGETFGRIGEGQGHVENRGYCKIWVMMGH